MDQKINHKSPVLIVGLPRSGTTWVGEVFSSARDTSYVFEPDNEKLSPLAWLCKKNMHRFPYLTAMDDSCPYHDLWRAVMTGSKWTWYANAALGFMLKRKSSEVEAWLGDKNGYFYIDDNMHRVGGRRIKGYTSENHPTISFLTRQLLPNRNISQQNYRVIVKSVHSSLSADWISSRFPVKVVFVLRNPYSLYASYRRMKMPDGFRNLMFQETLQRDELRYMPELSRMFMVDQEDPIAFQIMLMYKIIEKQITLHPEWILISHDRLCMTPQEGYKRIFEELNLIWSDATDTRINALNETGKGFSPHRVSSQQPSKWKSEITDSERLSILRWVDKFDLHSFFQQHVDVK